MKDIDAKLVSQYVEEHIGDFHDKRAASLDSLKLGSVLKRKNPYLFRAKNALTSEQIVRGLVDAHISSNEETLFGNWLEGLAIFINRHVYGGYKSGIKGVDLEFDKDGVRYIVAIKSGPNWGNSSQIAKMIGDFRTAKKTLCTSNSKLVVQAVNGCCYGRDTSPHKGDYLKYCGQMFWHFISNDHDLYTNIVEPIGHKAKEKNAVFAESYSSRINLFTQEFSGMFCNESGAIDWDRLVRFNSAEEKS